MNLVRDPWIPVAMQDGTSSLVSLQQVFQDGEIIADLAANPCQRIALMRLLICIAQAALDGPKDEDDWLACRPHIASAALAYLDKWQERFNLFGEHAFLQVDGLNKEPNALADKIDFTLSCGNNPTLFDHSATQEGRLHDEARLALNLLVYQMFSPGGLIGTTGWGNQVTEKTSEHAPCLEGSMLHLLLRGKTIIQSISLNLLTKEQAMSTSNTVWGVPSWELETQTRKSLTENSASYLGRLVPSSRAIYLERGTHQIVLAAGILYNKLPIQREPMGTVIEVGSGLKKHPSYVSVNPAKHPWRELPSILALQKADNQGGALCLNHIRRINDTLFDIWTGGLSADKAKLIDMAEWNLGLPTDLLDTLVLARYQKGVELANSAKAMLVFSVKTYSEQQTCEPIWKEKAESIFWSELDRISEVLVQASVQSDEAVAIRWVPAIRQALRTAYSQTCPHETPRQIQAYAQGLKIIESWKGK